MHDFYRYASNVKYWSYDCKTRNNEDFWWLLVFWVVTIKRKYRIMFIHTAFNFPDPNGKTPSTIISPFEWRNLQLNYKVRMNALGITLTYYAIRFQPSPNVNIMITTNTTELLPLLVMFYVTHAYFSLNADEEDSIPPFDFSIIARISDPAFNFWFPINLEFYCKHEIKVTQYL